LIALRVLAGIGLGSIGPAALAFGAEYAPKRLKASIPSWIWAAVPAGGMIAGLSAVWLLPVWGWPSLFIVAGVLPIILAVPLGMFLPESLSFLGTHGNDQTRMRRIAQRIAPTLPAEAELYSSEESLPGVPLKHLFREGRALGTVLLWIINFMNLLNLYFLTNWLPTVVAQIGYSTPVAVRVGATLQLAGAIGAFLQGWLVNRIGFVPVLATGFALAAINIAYIGHPGISLALLVVVVSIAGLGIVGGQSGVNAFSATYYPTDLRSTGVGAGLGVGRVGAIVGPYVGGVLLGMKWSAQELFLAAAVPALISAFVMAWMHWVAKPAATAQPASAQAPVAG